MGSVINLVGLVAVVSLLFFSAIGAFLMLRVCSGVLSELNIPLPKMTPRRWYKVISVSFLFPVMGVVVLLDSKWIEAGMRFGLVVAMYEQGILSEEQAKSYLLSKSIRWTP